MNFRKILLVMSILHAYLHTFFVEVSPRVLLFRTSACFLLLQSRSNQPPRIFYSIWGDLLKLSNFPFSFTDVNLLLAILERSPYWRFPSEYHLKWMSYQQFPFSRSDWIPYCFRKSFPWCNNLLHLYHWYLCVIGVTCIYNNIRVFNNVKSV